MDAVKKVLSQASGDTSTVLEAATLNFAQWGLQRTNEEMTARKGSDAFFDASQSWIFMQRAFPSGIPQDRLDNYFNAIKVIAQNKAPNMMPIVDDIMLLRSSYTIDPQKSQSMQRGRALDLIVIILGRALHFAFDEKAKPDENAKTRSMRAQAGGLVIRQWESADFRSVQTPEWQARYDSVKKRLEDIAMGR